MTEKTDPSPSAEQAPSASVPSSAPPAKPQKKPRFALFVATAAGLGYFPKAPGTLGSLAGLVLTLVPWWALVVVGIIPADGNFVTTGPHANTHDPLVQCQVWIFLTVGALGVWAASRAASYWSQKDPQRVVIDEVSGQHLALLIGCLLPLLSGEYRIEGSWKFGLDR